MLSRLDNKKTSWKIETFDAERFIEHIYDVMSVSAKERAQTLTMKCESDIPDVTADKEKLQQVIINIVSNAIKYTPKGGNVAITAKNSGEFFLISVSDNGIGIPKDDLPRIFERFYRVEKSRTSDAGGTGLGLAIAKEIIDAHGGDIKIDSEIGRGTHVDVFIPYKTKLENV